MIIRTMTSRRNDVYGVYSPVFPSVEQMLQQFRTGVDYLQIAQTWINPDRGLKTRHREEVIPALEKHYGCTSETPGGD